MTIKKNCEHWSHRIYTTEKKNYGHNRWGWKFCPVCRGRITKSVTKEFKKEK